MLHALLFVLAASSADVPQSPRSGARCAASRDVYALGTGNIPGSSGRATTVVNIWFYAPAAEHEARPGDPKVDAIAWVYKTYAGKYWIQVNSFQYSSAIRKAFPHPLADELLEGATAHELPRPYLLNHLSQFDGNFRKLRAVRTDCFTGDFPSKYL